MQSGHKGWEPFAAMRDQDAVPTEADIKNMAMRKLGNVVWFIVIRAI